MPLPALPGDSETLPAPGHGSVPPLLLLFHSARPPEQGGDGFPAPPIPAAAPRHSSLPGFVFNPPGGAEPGTAVRHTAHRSCACATVLGVPMVLGVLMMLVVPMVLEVPMMLRVRMVLGVPMALGVPMVLGVPTVLGVSIAVGVPTVPGHSISAAVPVPGGCTLCPRSRCAGRAVAPLAGLTRLRVNHGGAVGGGAAGGGGLSALQDQCRGGGRRGSPFSACGFPSCSRKRGRPDWRQPNIPRPVGSSLRGSARKTAAVPAVPCPSPVLPGGHRSAPPVPWSPRAPPAHRTPGRGAGLGEGL